MTDETNETTVPATEESAASPAGGPKKKGFFAALDNFFGISRMGSSFKIEIIAGLTTFMAMVYILMVNPAIFTATKPVLDEAGNAVIDPATGQQLTEAIIPGLSYHAMYVATAIGAVVGTLLMAFLARMPLAQASGMGINAFIVYSLLSVTTGLTYANCMVFTLLDGVIFLILTVTGLRKKIFEAIPESVRHAVPVGIGLFIAFIGLQNANVIVGSSTLVSFTSFNVLAEGFTFHGVIPPLVALLGVIAIAVMSKKNVKGSVLWGILGSAALYYALNGVGCAFDEGCRAVFTAIPGSFSNPFAAFRDWGTQSAGKVFSEGFDFGAFLGANGGAAKGAGALVLMLITTALSLCMIDMFDTIGTLYGACARGNLLDETGTPINMNKMMLADSIATCAGAIVGTSTVTTFVESSSGVAAGGRTGFAALVTAILFFIAMFLSPLAQLIPGCATAAALIWVGVLMMSSVTKIDWSDAAEAIVAFLTFIVMVLGYSISKGIGIGIIAFVLVKVCTGKVKEISAPTWVICVLFLAMFILT